MLNILETHLREGDRVYSIGSPRTYIGRVTKVLPTLFYAVDQSGLEAGYAMCPDRMILVER